MTDDEKFYAVRAKCDTAAAKVVYEGVCAVHTMSGYRTWDNLFPTERAEIIRMIDDGSTAWWATLTSEMGNDGVK